MSPIDPPYVSFLLRLWLAGDGDQPQWRFSLENPHTGERWGFSSLEELAEFLKGVIAEENQHTGLHSQ